MSVKMIPSVLIFLACWCMHAQEATEIYLFDLIDSGDDITLKNPVNISDAEGYDNQPSFTEDGTGILFSSFRDGQADIVKYFIEENYRVWLTNTPHSEFSPMPYPGKKKLFTCVRQDTSGVQHVYQYAYKKKPPVALIDEVMIGYYLWFNPKTIVSFVIDDVETLMVSNFKYKIRYPIEYGIGRSINKIPSSAGQGMNKVSYVSMKHETPEIYSINPKNSKTNYITDALPGSQDMAWTLSGHILMGNGDSLFAYHPVNGQQWKRVKIESDLPLDEITRICVSPDGRKIALVVGE